MSIIYFPLLVAGVTAIRLFRGLRIWVLADEEPALGVYEANIQRMVRRDVRGAGEWIG